MSSEAIDTAGNAGPVQPAHLPTEDRISAANREALAEFEAAAPDEGEPIQADDAEDGVITDYPSDEEVSDGSDDDADEAEDLTDEEAAESEDEVEAQPVGIDWDGDPDTVPPELKPGFDRQMALMNKGVNKKLREIAEERQKLEALGMQYQSAMLQLQQQAKNPNVNAQSGPPSPPGEGATAADWQKYDAENTEYITRKVINDLRASGQIPDSEKVAQLQWKQDLNDRYLMITRLDGATDEIVGRMGSMAEADDRYLQKFATDEGAVQFFNEAKLAVERDKLAAEKAALAAERAKSAQATATRKAGAANRATTRPGSVKAGSSPVDTFNKKAFRGVDEQIEHLNAEILREAGL